MHLVRPGCLVWYPGDPCDLLIQQYHQVLADQQRQEWQSSVTSRFERQIADQQKQITEQQSQLRTLQARIDSQTMEALRSEARGQAFVDGVGVIIGIALAFVLVVAAFRKLSHDIPADAEQSRAASARSGW